MQVGGLLNYAQKTDLARQGLGQARARRGGARQSRSWCRPQAPEGLGDGAGCVGPLTQACLHTVRPTPARQRLAIDRHRAVLNDSSRRTTRHRENLRYADVTTVVIAAVAMGRDARRLKSRMQDTARLRYAI